MAAAECVMPSRADLKMDQSSGQVRLKALYSGDILITIVDSMTAFKDLCEEVGDLCGLHQQHLLTLKWANSEGDPVLWTWRRPSTWPVNRLQARERPHLNSTQLQLPLEPSEEERLL